MLVFSLRTLLLWPLLWLISASHAAAQASAELPPPALALETSLDAALIDPQALRVQLERELGVAVASAADSTASQRTPRLHVEARSLARVRVSLVREDGSRAERSFDASHMSEHALATIAIVAANLMRDEAAELLRQLRAQAAPEAVANPAPAPDPAVVPGPAAAPPPDPAALPDPAPPPVPPGCAPRRLRRVTVGADLVPYVGTSRADGTAVERSLSLNLLGGLSGAVRGFELSGLFSIDTRALCGVQLSAGMNWVGGPAQGGQLAFVNWAGGRVDGAQLGLVNVAGGPLQGAQLGLLNAANGSVRAAQVGFVNLAAGDVRGTQLGWLNVGTRRIAGAQLGLLNVAAAPLAGAQLGLVNVSAAKVHGAMIGLVNVAEDADAALGLVNVLWRGRTHLDVWATDAGLFLVGVEHGGSRVHNIFAAGMSARDGRALFAPTYGLGVRLFSHERLFVDLDALVYVLLMEGRVTGSLDVAAITQLRVPISVRLTRDVAIYASPAVNLSMAPVDDNRLADPALYDSLLIQADGDVGRAQLWPGFTAGLRFF